MLELQLDLTACTMGMDSCKIVCWQKACDASLHATQSCSVRLACCHQEIVPGNTQKNHQHHKLDSASFGLASSALYLNAVLPAMAMHPFSSLHYFEKLLYCGQRQIRLCLPPEKKVDLSSRGQENAETQHRCCLQEGNRATKRGSRRGALLYSARC